MQSHFLGPTQYIIRFDDICPAMNWPVWEQIEQILSDAGIKPILSVVPDNEDPELETSPPNADFWERVRAWQSQGSAMALHGRSGEFADFSSEIQELKIRSALSCFAAQKVRVQLWAARADSFDGSMLSILDHYGLRTVSDGRFLYPGFDKDGLFWLPQQLSRFAYRPFGVWTICLHHNSWGPEDVTEFANSVEAYRERITDFETIVDLYSRRQLSLLDRSYSRLFQWRMSAERSISNWFGDRWTEAAGVWRNP